MATIEITNNASNGVVVWEPVFQDEILLDASATTYAAGTVLGRITASGKLTKYTSGAADGSEVPIAVLTYEQELAAGVDTPARALIAGRVRRGDLIAVGVGAITDAEADALRDYGIIPQVTQQLAELDNQ